MILFRLWDNSGRSFGTESRLTILVFVTSNGPEVSLHKETQDYAARFGVSSEAFVQLFETAFPCMT
jgi:hypothetical protein